MCVDTIIVLLCYHPSTLSSTISPRTPRSRDSISPSKISCSGLRNKLPGLPVTIEGDMLPTEITDEFGGMLPESYGMRRVENEIRNEHEFLSVEMKLEPVVALRNHIVNVLQLLNLLFLDARIFMSGDDEPCSSSFSTSLP